VLNMFSGQVLKHEIRTCEKNRDPYVVNMRRVLLTARERVLKRGIGEATSRGWGIKVYKISSAFSQVGVNDIRYTFPCLHISRETR